MNHPPAPSSAWCLFLDVDGTLVEITDTPFDTHVPDTLKSLLGDVGARLGGGLALVSGRSVECLDTLFAPLRLPTAGLHGVERRAASGQLHGATFDDSHLDRARAVLAQAVRDHPGTLLEDKGRTLGMHYRLAPQFESAVRTAVHAVAAALGDNFHVQAGNMLFEIKPRGFSKGEAIDAFLLEPPFAGRVPVFVGDDLTDLDGFTVVEARGGISVGVGERVRGRYQLDDPAAVRRWLAQIAALPYGRT